MKQPGHCCPECVGHRDAHVNPPGGHCLLANHLQYNGSTSTHLDQCASCTCMNNNITCTRRTCPPLTCPVLYQVAGESGDCCPVCRLPEVSLQCAYKGVVYEHGSEWRLTGGRERVVLSALRGPARRLSRLRRSKFQLKIINHPHSTNSVLPFMRSLVLKLHLGTYKIKVTMMVSRKTKVNGSRVQLPYRHRQDVLVIDQVGHGIQLNTTMGLQLLWDGESYIELVLDSKWQNKTCGLCGNFNGDMHDDLTRSSSSREAEFRRVSGSSEAEADDLSLTEAARSWARGRCSRRQRDHLREVRGGARKNILARVPEVENNDWPFARALARLRFSDAMFSTRPLCWRATKSCPLNPLLIVSIPRYFPPKTELFVMLFRACVDDMCRCSGERQCQCGAIMAYARECHRLGVSIPSWRNVTKCGGLECPRGAEYMECAPACRPTCRNPHPNPDCHTRRCSPGCYCPFPTVLHRGACIPTSQCPDSESQNFRRKSQRSRRLPSTRLLLPRSRGPSSKRGRVIGKQDIFQEHRLLSSSVP
ncbi:hypothetical protein HAZT_HAZT000942 [Hyalella azteca]|uniref:VWFD domain-containing protein n=1 Tax=Hyalella azteca TaxID=294128 RepID=A0A6A0GYN0_HYAAZ|nr:hypothetical protein HAZT_HAZT000942 [Hyalella azteca]